MFAKVGGLPVLHDTPKMYIPQEVIQKIVGSEVKLLDSGKAIAKYTKTLLQKKLLENEQDESGKTIYFTTLDPLKFSKVASLLLKDKIEAKGVAF